MAVHEINWNPTRSTLRQFAGIWFPAFFGLIAWWVWRATGSATTAAWVLVPALILSVIGLLFPAFMKPIFVGWMVAVFPIGWTISHVVLAATYYLVFTPLGCMMRLAGYDPMRCKFDRQASSYWTPHQQPQDKSAYFRQY